MTRSVPLALAVCVVVAFVAKTSAQVFRSSSQTVAIYATVVDSDNHLATDLEQKDFEVYDNGVLKPLTLFKSDIQPITVVVMLDTSGSMTMDIDLLKTAAERFVLRLLPEDRARIGSFNDKIIISPRFIGNRDDLVRIIHNDIQFGNPTYLWDAIDASMSALASESGRRVVLVFTDGEDDRSQRTDYGKVQTRAVAEDFMIYAIGRQTRILGQLTKPDRKLAPLASSTGGGYYELKEGSDLNSTFTRVADELHRQYVIGFSADNLDGTMHKLDVRVKVPGMAVRARKGYLASKAGVAATAAPTAQK
ncbi:MAG: VWA domain-containing protein [Acidobacteriota bacterium]